MFDRMLVFFLADPRRLTSLGTAFGWVGGFLLVSGMVGRVITKAVSVVHGITGNRHSEATLGDVLPTYISVWMPESAVGFCLATLMLALGLWFLRTGQAYERQLGIWPY